MRRLIEELKISNKPIIATNIKTGEEYEFFPHQIIVNISELVISIYIDDFMIPLYIKGNATPMLKFNFGRLNNLVASNIQKDAEEIFILFAKQASRDGYLFTRKFPNKTEKIHCDGISEKYINKTNKQFLLTNELIEEDSLYNYDYHRLQFLFELYNDKLFDIRRNNWLPTKISKDLSYSKNGLTIFLDNTLGLKKSKITSVNSNIKPKKSTSFVESESINNFNDFLDCIDLNKEYLIKFNKISGNDINKRVREENFEWSDLQEIEVIKPFSNKVRKTFSASREDRVIQTAITKYLNIKYSGDLHNSCFSFREGVSTNTAIKYLKDNKAIGKYSVKIDISKYFDSVPFVHIENIFRELLKNDDKLYNIVMNLYTRNEYIDIDKNKITKYLSLIQGCSIATFLGNYLLKDLDSKMSKLSNNLYARYCDDIIIFADTEEKIQTYLEILENDLRLLGLSFNRDKLTYYSNKETVEFLGLLLHQDGVIDIANSTFVRAKKMIKHFAKMNKMQKKKLSLTIKDINNYFYDTDDIEQRNWNLFVFNNITTINTLRELDFYTINTLRALETGKHNKANIGKVSLGYIKDLGYISFVESYFNFRNNPEKYRWNTQQHDNRINTYRINSLYKPESSQILSKKNKHNKKDKYRK